MSTAEGNKAQLMQDLEAKIVAANAAKGEAEKKLKEVSGQLKKAIESKDHDLGWIHKSSFLGIFNQFSSVLQLKLWKYVNVG